MYFSGQKNPPLRPLPLGTLVISATTSRPDIASQMMKFHNTLL